MTLSSAVRDAMIGNPERIQPDFWSASFFFPETFAGFDGHFPGNPILPGIVQILGAALAVHPEGPSRIRKIRRTKFVAMVRPGDTMTVKARLRDLPQAQADRTSASKSAPTSGSEPAFASGTDNHAGGAGRHVLVQAECSTGNGVCANIELALDLS